MCPALPLQPQRRPAVQTLPRPASRPASNITPPCTCIFGIAMFMTKNQEPRTSTLWSTHHTMPNFCTGLHLLRLHQRARAESPPASLNSITSPFCACLFPGIRSLPLSGSPVPQRLISGAGTIGCPSWDSHHEDSHRTDSKTRHPATEQSDMPDRLFVPDRCGTCLQPLLGWWEWL